MAEVLLSSLFVRQFRGLPADAQRRIRNGLAALADDPIQSRPGADVRRLAGTNPPKHRLRVGDYRIVYAVEGGTVRALDLFSRGRGYRLD
jgi:mRNA interferase RelE/StbE